LTELREFNLKNKSKKGNTQLKEIKELEIEDKEIENPKELEEKKESEKPKDYLKEIRKSNLLERHDRKNYVNDQIKKYGDKIDYFNIVNNIEA